MTSPRPRLPRLPFALLGLMTAFTFGGPVGIGSTLRGGRSPDWPPDRPIEWVVFVGVSGMVLALMLACLSLTLAHRKAIRRGPSPTGPDRAGDRP